MRLVENLYMRRPNNSNYLKVDQNSHKGLLFHNDNGCYIALISVRIMNKTKSELLLLEKIQYYFYT